MATARAGPPPSTNSHSAPRIHPQAFWVLGVIAGFALRETLASGLAKINTLNELADRDKDPALLSLILARVVIFVLLTVRFYLGAAYYFERHYPSGPRADGNPNYDYGLDFLLALIHFNVFYVCAVYVAATTRYPFWIGASISGFQVLLAVLLLWDLLWWFLARKRPDHDPIRRWAVINALTFVAGVLVFFLSKVFLRPEHATVAEAIALISVVGLVTVLDVIEIVTGKETFKAFFRWLGNLQRG